MGKGRILTSEKEKEPVAASPEEGAPIVETPAEVAPANPEPEAPTNPEPAENPGELAEAERVVEEAVEEGLDSITDVADSLADVQSKVMDIAGRLSQALAALTVSGAGGMLAIPKVGEAKGSFEKRIKARHPEFDISVWHRDDEAIVRKKFPGNFGGEGW